MGSRHRDISRTVVLLPSLLVQKKTCLLFSLFALLARPLAKKYHGDAQSDLDFLIFGGDGFRLTEILFSLMRHRII